MIQMHLAQFFRRILAQSVIAVQNCENFETRKSKQNYFPENETSKFLKSQNKKKKKKTTSKMKTGMYCEKSNESKQIMKFHPENSIC